jgi:hypothetical protein
MSLIATMARSNKARFLFALAAAWGGFQLWLTLEAPRKIAPELAGQSAKVNVVVELPFTPERFHLLTFQQYGRVSGADDHSVELRGVRRADLQAVARPYWVKRVEPIREGE